MEKQKKLKTLAMLAAAVLGAWLGLWLLGPVLLPFALGLLLAAPAVLARLVPLPLGRGLRRRLRCRGGLLRRRGVGENDLEPGDLVVLGQVLKDDGELLLVQVLSGLLGDVEVPAQDLDDLPGLQAEILRQLVDLILVHNTTQYGHLQ